MSLCQEQPRLSSAFSSSELQDCCSYPGRAHRESTCCVLCNCHSQPLCAPCICDAATALAKLHPSFTAAVVKAYAAAATGVDLSARHADAVMRDTLTVEAACMRLVQGDEGGGRLKTGEEVNRLNRRTQQTLPCLTALLRKKEARPGLACLVEKKRAARAAAHGGMVDGVRGAPVGSAVWVLCGSGATGFACWCVTIVCCC